MIISSNPEPSLQDFQELINDATFLLNIDASATKRMTYYLKRNAQLLEDDVKRFLDAAAIGTDFEGTIEKVSGQRFPDIVAAGYYGVEVKSSRDEKWMSIGGSVNESTRIKGVERIFLIFGKLTDPVEFRSRPYEDCLYDVAVTHYPRYKIDMNLSKNETLFAKMNTTYDDLRLSPNPVSAIVNYYKSQLADGESLWWIDSSKQDDRTIELPMKVRLMRTLSKEEKEELSNVGYAYFPSIFGGSNKKYEQFSLWLVSKHGVVSTSTRDLFSSGGQKTLEIANTTFDKIPRKIYNVSERKNIIKGFIFEASEDALKETWQVDWLSDDRIGQWIDLVSQVCKAERTNVREILNAIFER